MSIFERVSDRQICDLEGYEMEETPSYESYWIPITGEDGEPIVFTYVKFEVYGDNYEIHRYDREIEQFLGWEDDINEFMENY